MTQFIDLSISIEPDLPSDPPMMIPKIDYVDHKMGAEQMKDFFPGEKGTFHTRGITIFHGRDNRRSIQRNKACEYKRSFGC